MERSHPGPCVLPDNFSCFCKQSLLTTTAASCERHLPICSYRLRISNITQFCTVAGALMVSRQPTDILQDWHVVSGLVQLYLGLPGVLVLLVWQGSTPGSSCCLVSYFWRFLDMGLPGWMRLWCGPTHVPGT